MKEKVLELQQIFVDRIEAGEFDVVGVCNNGYVTFSIDGYVFCYGYVKSVDRVFQGTFDNFMKLPEINYPTHLIQAIENGLKEAKLIELAKLQKEIDNYEIT